MLYVFIIVLFIIIILSIFNKNIETLDGAELSGTILSETSTGEGIYSDISRNYDIIAQSFSAATDAFPDINDPYYESSLKYDSTLKNLNVEYHKSAADIINESSLPFGTIVVQNTSGELVYLRDPQIIGTPIYYDSLNIRYNPQSYVPSYEDAMYLREQHKYEEKPLQNNTDNFCKTAATRGSKYNQEIMCQSIPSNKCHMYDCCVNLGGAKCVAGNQYGPLLNSNYGDMFIKNRDYYYYQGLCYGNCRGSLPPISAATSAIGGIWIPKN